MKASFPKDFIFGVADADLQVVGEDVARKHENSLETMWMRYAKTSGKVHENDTPSIGVDRYTLWRQDVKLLKKLGVKDYRTSVSMARTLNTDGTLNSKSIEWYRSYFKELKKEGIKIYVTLYHWELPQFLHEKGGWTNKKTIEFFLKHSLAVYNHLNEYIEEYFILNEPRCSSLVAHYYGAHAPGETDLSKALLVAHNLMLAQGKVFQELSKQNKNLKLSTVINVGPRYAATSDKNDILAAKYVDGHKNLWFLDPIFKGEYPDFMVKLYGKHMPKIQKGDMEIIKIGDKLHTLALNYYRGDIVKYDASHELKFKTFILEKGPKSDLGWGIFVPPFYKEGLYDILEQVYYSYKDYGLKRMYIAENGTAEKAHINKRTGDVSDPKRISYISSHLKQIYDAILRGIPVTSYFAWTFMDNFEWAEGYKEESRFGMVYVDRKTMKRVPKSSYYWYKKLINTKTLEA